MALQLIQEVNVDTELNKLEANQISLLKSAKNVSTNLKAITISLALTLERKYTLLNMESEICNIASEVQRLLENAEAPVYPGYADYILAPFNRFLRQRTVYEKLDTYDLPSEQVENMHTSAVRSFEKLSGEEDSLKKKLKKTLRRIKSLEERAKIEHIPLMEKISPSKLRISKTLGLKANSKTEAALTRYRDMIDDIIEKVHNNSPAISEDLDEQCSQAVELQIELIEFAHNDKNVIDARQKLEFARVADQRGKYIAPKTIPLVSNVCAYCYPKRIKTFDYDPDAFTEMVFYPHYTDSEGINHKNIWVCRRCGRTERLETYMSWENIEKFNSSNQTYKLAKKIIAAQPFFAGLMRWFRSLEQPKRVARIIKTKHKFSNSS